VRSADYKLAEQIAYLLVKQEAEKKAVPAIAKREASKIIIFITFMLSYHIFV
jgi:hypothetical protein